MGPLHRVRVVELAGIGPGPFCAMVLSDLGADVVVVDRHARTTRTPPQNDPLMRGRRSIILDLKQPEAVAAFLRLTDASDVLIDPFRPGVAERLGIGPEVCCARNPRLIYGRMTGWGQQGPYAANAGHDINYIALAGALEGIGLAGQRPTPPQNLVGDFGGGGMLLALGIAAALFERGSSGQGQVIDSAMVDGTALLTASTRGLQAAGVWHEGRGTNLLDGGAHFYNTYETADQKWISVGCNEPQFYANVLRCLGLEDDEELATQQFNEQKWTKFQERFAAVFITKTRDEWCAIFDGEAEACFAPVLSIEEAPWHLHLRHRNTFVQVGDMLQPAPAPRFSRTPASAGRPGVAPGRDTDDVLAEVGLNIEEIALLRASGAAH